MDKIPCEILRGTLFCLDSEHLAPCRTVYQCKNHRVIPNFFHSLHYILFSFLIFSPSLCKKLTIRFFEGYMGRTRVLVMVIRLIVTFSRQYNTGLYAGLYRSIAAL